MSGTFETILNSFFEVILIAIVSFVAYQVVEKYFDGRTFKNAVESIEKSVALGVDTVVNLEVLKTAVNVTQNNGIDYEKLKEVLEIVRS